MNWRKIWETVGIPIVTGFVVAFLGALLPPAPIFKSLPIGPTFWQAIIGGLIGVVLGVVLWYVLIRRCGPLARRSVTITSPTPNSHIPRQVLVQGTACHIGQKELWILVQAGGHYYPQPGPVDVADDGTWIADAWVGLPNQVRVGFVLCAVLADHEAGIAIREKRRPPYEALEPLPKGIQKMSEVPVIRT